MKGTLIGMLVPAVSVLAAFVTVLGDSLRRLPASAPSLALTAGVLLGPLPGWHSCPNAGLDPFEQMPGMALIATGLTWLLLGYGPGVAALLGGGCAESAVERPGM